jgi:hypothetical protein
MSIARRAFLGASGIAALSACVPGPAWARRILEPGPDPTAPAIAGVSPEFRRALRTLRVGHVARHGDLLVFWLHATEAAPALPVSTLDEARAAGALVIAELDRATVPEVTVDNRGKLHVLLLAGEILVGGEQNRVLREDILLPPGSGPRAIGVYCVEQGRWNEGRRDFESKSSFAQPGLRREVYDKADQARVWSEVARSTRAAAAPSPTGSYQQVYEQPAVKEHLTRAEDALEASVPVGASGAAVFVASTLSGLDLFRDPGLFARQWRKLLRAHAVEAYGKSTPTPVPEAHLRAALDAILRGAADTSGMVRGNAGVGQIFEFKLGRSRGLALTYDGGLVHAAIL